MWTGRTCSGLSTSNQAVRPHPAYPIGKLFSQWLCQPGMCNFVYVTMSHKCKIQMDLLMCPQPNGLATCVPNPSTLSHVKPHGTHSADAISKFFSQWLCQPGMFNFVFITIFTNARSRWTCYTCPQPIYTIPCTTTGNISSRSNR